MSYNDDNNNYGGGNRGGYGDDQQQGGYGGSNQGRYDDEGRQGGRQEEGYSQGGYGAQEGRQGQGYGQGGYGQSNSGTPYGGGGSGASDDFSGAENHAQEYAGDSGDRSMFSQALSGLMGNQQHLQNQPVDEDHAVQSHQAMYGNGSSGGQQFGTGMMGSAAAMQALKMFNGGGGSGGSSGGASGLMGMAQQFLGGSSGGSSGGQSGGGSQNQFIGMAMGEASKLFDQQSANGQVAPGTSKQSVVNEAAMTAMKFYMKSQMSGGGGGAGGLMSLASKFM